MDYQGTISRGIRAPIIRQGDDLVQITADCVVNASKEGGFPLQDKDVVAVTEAVLARAQGNYATIDHIAKDVQEKFGDNTVGLIFPIFSRNRFSMILKGIAKGAKKLIVMLSYPSDEVGNSFVTLEQLMDKDVNPYTDVFTAEEFHKLFGDVRHTFTGVDYIEFYEQTGNCEVILANNPTEILKHTKYVINADIHSRKRTKKILEKAEKNSVTVITVGTLTNIAEILEKEPKLFNEKVCNIVAMAGKFPSGKEFNIESDIACAKQVFENFKNVIVCSGFEVGAGVMTGFETEAETPVFDCYKEYLGGKAPYLRDSWDLTAVHFAFEGCGDYYSLSKAVKITVDDSGNMISAKDKYAKRFYIKRKTDKPVLAEYLNGILNG